MPFTGQRRKVCCRRQKEDCKDGDETDKHSQCLSSRGGLAAAGTEDNLALWLEDDTT